MSYFQYTLDDLHKNSAKKEFNYITFFAGGGGSSCAYKLAGGDVKYMNEFQQIHVDTYLENFPNTVHECKDIKEVTGKDYKKVNWIPWMVLHHVHHFQWLVKKEKDGIKKKLHME